jgi:hypothetical protein
MDQPWLAVEAGTMTAPERAARCPLIAPRVTKCNFRRFICMYILARVRRRDGAAGDSHVSFQSSHQWSEPNANEITLISICANQGTFSFDYKRPQLTWLRFI